jgi:hypothetical protein
MKFLKQPVLICASLLFIHSPVFGQSSGKFESITLHKKDVLILGEGRRGPYFLPDSMIIQNSESVWIDQVTQEKPFYEIDYIAGEIRFQEPVPQGGHIRLVYKVFPYTIKKTYTHRPLRRRVLGAPLGPAVPELQKPPEEGEENYASQLDKSGSITRGITVGSNRGLKVNSSLNLNISGKVAENVEVVAALTDQTTPIQPEGTTQNLQEIDKVFVKITAPNMSATMGDYNLDLSGSQFARYSRKLQGAMGTAEFDRFGLLVSGAVSKGKFRTMSFMGQEGNQGPYQLTGDRGQIDIIVLAGTERVYIDGEPMVRGETNDYIIDYAAAQITFTRSRLITSDSRIVVDFQFSDEKFRRNLYAVNSHATGWNDKIHLATTFLREADDKDNPLDFTLSQENLHVLQNAGDDPQKAVVDGAVYVGPGKGRYNRNDQNFFVYVGNDSGEYNVVFSDVGDGQGNYRYKGAGIYEYAGEKLGRYAPVIPLPTARSHDLLDVGLDFSPYKEIGLRGEVALSSYDLNTYSAIGDGDNQGVAQNWELQIKPDSVRLFGMNVGAVDFSGHFRKIDHRFQDIDRTTEVEYNRRWDLPQVTSREELVKEMQAAYRPVKGFEVGGEYGQIRKGSYFRSNRWLLRSQLKKPSLPEYNYSIERINKNASLTEPQGDWLRQKGNASYRLWRLRPFFQYEGEVKKENWADTLATGFKFDDVTAGMEFSPSRKIGLTTKLSRRNDKDYAGADRFADKSTARTQSVGLQLQNVGTLSASVEYTHREREFADPAVSDKRTDLAEIRSTFTPLKRALNTTWNYQISNTATAKQERVYIKVSPGDGNYRFDEELKEFVNDPLGDYILRILTTDEFIPVVELKTSSTVKFEPQRFWTGRVHKEGEKRSIFQETISSVSTETYVAIEERSQEKDVWSIYLLDLSKYQNPNATIFGNINFRQDMFLFENNRNYSLRLRYQSIKEKNNQFLEGGQDRLEREKSARLKSRFSNKFNSQSEFTHKQISRAFDYSGRQNRDIYSNQLKLDLSYRPTSPLEIALESRYAREEDRFYEEPTRVNAIALVPRVNYSFRSKGRLRAEVEWSQVSATPSGRVIPFEMADGRSLGSSARWDIRFDYRISSTIQATFSYSGRNEPERSRTIHTGRAEVTAAFR